MHTSLLVLLACAQMYCFGPNETDECPDAPQCIRSHLAIHPLEPQRVCSKFVFQFAKQQYIFQKVLPTQKSYFNFQSHTSVYRHNTVAMSLTFGHVFSSPFASVIWRNQIARINVGALPFSKPRIC